VELETHGRWPLVGGVGLLPVTAAAARQPGLRPLAALLWHQTEEWVWPGAFLPWINRDVLGSSDDEFPIDRRLGFIINVVLGWGLSLGSLAGRRVASLTTALYVSHLGNAALHVSWAARHRRYDPGSVTAVLTLTPVAVSGLSRLVGDPAVPTFALRAGVAGGMAVSAGLVPALKSRLRRRG
jgi:Protein of unknown function with HXXEE motif